MEEEKALQLYLECYKDYLSLGLQRTLAAVPGVCNVRIESCLPVDSLAIAGWEQRYATELPADLRAFYLATDGLRLAWDYRVPAGDRFEIGRAEISPLSQLTRLGGVRHGADDPLTLLDLAGSTGAPDPSTDATPRLSNKWMVFELEHCGGNGTVCLACPRAEAGSPTPAASIWLLDASFRWHRLADSFVLYFRMLIAHLALPQWQWKFTPYGLSHWAQTWMTLIGPHLLPSSGPAANDSLRTLPLNRVDGALFRTRSRSRKDKEDKADTDGSETKH